MKLIWWLWEIGLLFATTVFFLVAWAYWDEVKKWTRRLRMDTDKYRENEDYIRLKIRGLKSDMGCWLVVGLLGMWAFADNLVNNIMR